MSSILLKNFHLCIPKLSCLRTALSPPSDQNHHTSSINSITPNLMKNFNALYELTSDSSSKSLTSSTDDFFTSSDYSDPENLPDITTVFASQRFFFSSPGRSNSIVESRESATESDPVVNGGVAVHTFSPDPYCDFRRSMQEMVEAHQLTDVKTDWDLLHKLLSSYLTLNPKHTHKIIVRAFADLVISLIMSSTTTNSSRKTEDQHQYCATSRRLV
ncbi:unnamed protein product [Ilex paraguariensis]|uniref:Transcription repressor n=1 Tax=Ilex paraguariensis TaxID=185542 RepID=A0ABC8SU79_9AQUA